MLNFRHSVGGSALVVTMLIAFSHVAVRTGYAAAVPPERPEVPAGTAPNSVLTFHTFDIEEVFSNRDGSVQFIELRETAGLDGQYHFAGNQLRSGTNLYTYPTDLPDPATANKFVLIATAAFAALPGAATPDYIIPERFFEVTGDTISIFEVQTNELVDTFVFGGPPQVDCTCVLDQDGNGIIQIQDILNVVTCADGGTPPPPLTCDEADLNCDGVVDYCDVSRVVCAFMGSPNCCEAEIVCGACCNSGANFDPCLVISEQFCNSLLIDEGDYLGDGTVCDPWPCEAPGPAPVFYPINPDGTCCSVGNGQCQDGVPEADCMGIGLVWTESTTCWALSCVATPLPTDGVLSLDSDGTTGFNSPTNFAGEIGSVTAVPPIPTMSRWSLVVMMLLLVTAATAITRTRRHGISPST